MGILTGDITPTTGEAYVAGHDVTGKTKDGVRYARKNIGFCPQIDPLLDLMTGRETLTMFGRLRGIPQDALVRQYIFLILRLIHLIVYANMNSNMLLHRTIQSIGFSIH